MANSTSQFGGFLTNVGIAQQANTAALGLPWNITHMLIGDAGGEPSQAPDPTPKPTQTALVRQVYRAQLNALYQSPADPGVLVAELVLPPETGGWWIRELGLEDANGNFIAVAKPAPSYKPLLQQGSGRTQTIRMHVVFGNVANINLKIDPSIVLATREYVDKAREAAELYARNQIKAHVEAPDPHPQYLRRADVARDAGPLAWLGAAAGTADALVLSLKSNEAALAAYAAGQRFQFQATATNTGAVTAKVGNLAAVAIKKAGVDGLVDLVAGDVRAGALYDLNYDGAVFQLGALLTTASALPVGSMLPFPKGTVPPGFLEVDGSVQSAAVYPDLAAYLAGSFNKGDEPAGYFRLPDSRGEFLRGWDHGRGVDAGRAIGSKQIGSGIRGTAGSSASGAQGNTWANTEFDEVGTLNHFTTMSPGAQIAIQTGVVRPRNLAVMWCIKAWNAPVNQGQIDVTALAAQLGQATEAKLGIAKIASQGQTDAGDSDEVIVTPKKLRKGFSLTTGPRSLCLSLPSWLGGYIFQIAKTVPGGVNAGGQAVQVAWPVAFPNECLLAIASCDLTGTSATTISASVFNVSLGTVGIALTNTGAGQSTNGTYIFGIGR